MIYWIGVIMICWNGYCTQVHSEKVYASAIECHEGNAFWLASLPTHSGVGVRFTDCEMRGSK